ncbi:RNA polymerase sigma factor [Pinibacter aurantiacus]|uniref:RNA polymerase sigma-70 factor n=1 Tax=Pinibacter aurantiacus TaxID=2851599 RepID=A0A9E2W5D6_9BACT|nr:RNA polymerase sigma-70 factor [Pinibacter aurantiacus]MBV4358789.1 RNA polymerase sigma-70 factor [Pinibacter aurantiacus]
MRVIPTDSCVALKSFQQGEEKGFQYFFHKYYGSLCHYVSEMTSDHELAQEIASDGFMKLWERRKQFFSDNTIRSFLFTVTRNAAISYIRTRSKTVATDIDGVYIADDHFNSLQSMMRAETYWQLHQAIERLPKVCRKVITMFYIQGMSYEQIAQELNISLANIRNQKARGIKLLREKSLGYWVILVVAIWMIWQ